MKSKSGTEFENILFPQTREEVENILEISYKIPNEDGLIRLNNKEIKGLLLLKLKNCPYDDSIIKKLFNNVWIEEIKYCLFRSIRWQNYTSIKINNKQYAGHRLSYEIFNGPLKFEQEICHNCDRRGCINPFHLFQGSHSDNMQDAKNKYRWAINFKR